jgi:small conductance mechanosensitive channel
MASLLAIPLNIIKQPDTTPTMIISTVQLIAIAGIMIVALVAGFLARRWLVGRLKKTVLDGWITQTLGALLILLLLLVGASAGLAIWNSDLFGKVLVTLQLDKVKSDQALAKNLIYTALIAVLGYGTARTMNNLITRSMGERRVDINIRIFFGRLLYIFILCVAGLCVLAVWSIPFGIPVAAVSVLTVAIAFAIQDILKDLVAGFYILIERPFFIGDQISITILPTVVYLGRVESVMLRATKLRLTSGEEVTIPNSTIFGGVVINNTFYGERRATLDVKLPTGDFVQGQTSETILKTLEGFGKVMQKPDPMVLFSGCVEGKVLLAVRFWVANGQVIDLSDVIIALHDKLPTAEITLREPIGIA